MNVYQGVADWYNSAYWAAELQFGEILKRRLLPFVDGLTSKSVREV